MMDTASLSGPRERAGSKNLLGRYSLTVCSSPRLVWFRNAKVGTRTLYHLLKDASVSFEIEHEFKVPFDPEQYGAYFKFAFVRNPWDRFVSGWKNKINPRKVGFMKLSAEQIDTFQDIGKFAEHLATLDPQTCNSHFRSQSALIEPDAVDYLGRFESFEADVRAIFGRLHLTLPDTFPHRNRSKREGSYQDYFTPRVRDLIGQFYRDDIKRFGYSFERG
ncbi:sulfotransferase family 2 domain-containing protein [Oricola sp.]|uniref:sulfotransferase family 2 domain-containing protein n=1 Tax=Oricola sp. TaxID=1979950 RepID=UPI0025CFFAFF|nr:sulfotransferase family 2 domain-containing protein [Oricola sp.]MCI5073750.1 sulfotransferase family protein [Oricola sp.]